MKFFIHKNCFELFSSAYFLFWDTFNLNLSFAVYVKLTLSTVNQRMETNRADATLESSISPLLSSSEGIWSIIPVTWGEAEGEKDIVANQMQNCQNC